jgi:hypothetical protein
VRAKISAVVPETVGNYISGHKNIRVSGMPTGEEFGAKRTNLRMNKREVYNSTTAEKVAR